MLVDGLLIVRLEDHLARDPEVPEPLNRHLRRRLIQHEGQQGQRLPVERQFAQFNRCFREEKE